MPETASESVASRDLTAAIESLRRFFSRHGVTVSGPALIAVLSAHSAQASIGTATVAATLSSASALAGTSAVGVPLFFALMKTTTSIKLAAVAVALLLTSGTVHYLTHKDGQPVQTKAEDQPTPAVDKIQRSKSAPEIIRAPTAPSRRTFHASTLPAEAKAPPAYDEAALQTARERHRKLIQRLGQLALMNNPLKVREILLNEYGIHLSVDEIHQLQQRGEKGLVFGVIDLWASRQPQEALTWAASTLAEASRGGGDFHRTFLDAARKTLPNLNRDTLAGMLPDGPGKSKMLDLTEAATDPMALASRILSAADPEERASRLRLLAQGWPNSEDSAEWARQNLGGAAKTAFYAQVGYSLAHQNPQAALQVLTELQGTDAYASTFGAMMRGLVQDGGLGKEAAELIAKSNLNAKDRTELISELARRWVRNNPDATIDWVNSLTAPNDFRVAIPLLVSQLDNDRVRRTVDAYLQNRDPVMGLALIEAASPTSLVFDPEKSRLILDPLIAKDPGLQLKSSEGSGASKEEMLWNSVNLTAKRQAEAGDLATAMEWLGKLPFARPSDYAQALGSVMAVWNVKSQTEAAEWLQNSALNPSLKSDLLKSLQP